MVIQCHVLPSEKHVVVFFYMHLGLYPSDLFLNTDTMPSVSTVSVGMHRHVAGQSMSLVQSRRLGFIVFKCVQWA